MGCCQEVFPACGFSRRWFVSNFIGCKIFQAAKELCCFCGVYLRKWKNCISWFCDEGVAFSLPNKTGLLSRNPRIFFIMGIVGPGGVGRGLSYEGNTFPERMEISEIRMRQKRGIYFFFLPLDLRSLVLFFMTSCILNICLSPPGYWSWWPLVVRTFLICQQETSGQERQELKVTPEVFK